jgi:hypothetical protein
MPSLTTSGDHLIVISDIDGVIADFVTSWLAYIYQSYGVAISPASNTEHDGLDRLLYKHMQQQAPQLLCAQNITTYANFIASKPKALQFADTLQLTENALPFFELLPIFIELSQADWVSLQFCTQRDIKIKELTEKWLTLWGLDRRRPTVYCASLKDKIAYVHDVAKRTRAQVLYLEDHPGCCELLNALAPRKNLAVYLPATTYNADYPIGNCGALRFPLRTLALQLKRLLLSTQPVTTQMSQGALNG